MTTKETSTREIGEDERRRQVKTYSQARKYLRERKKENGLTYSQQIAEWIPEPSEGVVHGMEDPARVKVTPAVHERLADMSGPRVNMGDVIAYYAMLDAIERGEIRVAADIVQSIPNVIMEVIALGAKNDG